MRSVERGFAVMEMVIVLVIFAIVASIAIPSYQNHVRQGIRADAKSGLMDVANHLEHYFSEHDTYTTDLDALGVGKKTPDGYYDIAITPGPFGITNGYVVIAKSNNKDVDPDCGSMTLSSNGKKTASSGRCW